MQPNVKTSPFSLLRFLQTLVQDIRFSFKVFLSNPKFTLVAVLTLAMGIAVNSTVFSWIDRVLLHPYPGVSDTKGLALIETVGSNGEHLVATSYVDYHDYRDNLKLVSAIAIGRFTPLSVGSGQTAERAWAELVSANYFDVLGVRPILGRAFLPEEGADKPGAFPIAVISYRMWQNRYHGDREVLGKTIRLNRHELTIIGVAPPDFRGTTVGLVYDVWMPITMAEAMGTGPVFHNRGCRDLTSTIVRLRPGVTIDQAQAEVGALAKRLAASYPETNRGVDATVVPVWAGHLGAQSFLLKPLQILTAICVLLMIIVCANVANLLLSRAVSRQKEIAIRLAFGARRARLIRQFLTETLLLAAAGAVLGVYLLVWMRESLNRLLPAVDFPFDLAGGLNLRTLGFTVLIVVIATVASGLSPALLSLRVNLNSTLNEGGRAGIGGSHSHKLRAMLVGIEVALAMVALVSAGLFLRSFHNASHIEPGFDTKNVSVSQFYLSNAGYSAQEQWSFCRRLRERMESIPGVIGVTYSDFVPLSSPGTSPEDELVVEGYVPAPNEQMLIHRATVPPGYFQFMGVPMLDGRDFTELDEGSAPNVMIVNETFAQRFFRGATAVGRIVHLEGSTATIVGVAKDSKYDTPVEEAHPYFYLPFRQWFYPGLNFSFLIKTMGDPMLTIPELRREALALNQDAYFHSIALNDAVGYSLFTQKVAASMLTAVAMLCLLLAAIGLYSVMSYAVSQRTPEFGIRIALGASSFDVVRMVTRQSLFLAVPGLIAGTVAALAMLRVFSGMLVGVRATDPLTFAGCALFVVAVTVLASYLPARRAVRIDPMTAVRCQ
ncbi:MAG TPA: ABC transporter permease [Candidatus Sulfotelmatobacter sp.]|nr:ABC transporter permease [Candidatus Sulfotelmatobacter sp.]